MEPNTPGKEAIRSVALKIEWALRMLEASAVPSAMNVDKLGEEFVTALKLRQAERATETPEESRAKGERNRGYDVTLTIPGAR